MDEKLVDMVTRLVGICEKQDKKIKALTVAVKTLVEYNDHINDEETEQLFAPLDD